MELAAEIHDFDSAMMDPLLALFGSHFETGDPILKPEVHDWLYCGNPFGTAKAVTVRAEAEWAGFMAMIPVDLARRGQRMKAYFVVDVLVDPKYRGQRLFLKMIDAAVDLARGEGASLMGHPNAAALPFWKRKRMQFAEDLQPALAVRLPQLAISRTSNIEGPGKMHGLGELSNQIPGAFSAWKVAADPAYLDWRYLRHPVTRYHVQLVEFRGGGIGLQVTKRARRGINMLIDMFVDPQHAAAAFHSLPLPTICFLTPSAMGRTGTGVIRLPLRKRMPVFVTDFDEPHEATEFSQLGLSPSDF